MTPYEALKAYGFSPAKAGEIILDASRGDKYAEMIIRLCCGEHLPGVGV